MKRIWKGVSEKSPEGCIWWFKEQWQRQWQQRWWFWKKDDEDPPPNNSQANALNATQNTLQKGQAAHVQPNGNNTVLNFLKASGLAGLMGNQYLPGMNALNGQNNGEPAAPWNECTEWTKLSSGINHGRWWR
jgi:hypothetical protein